VTEYPRSGIVLTEGTDTGVSCPKKVPWSEKEKFEPRKEIVS